jgi:group I intron endonuclease
MAYIYKITNDINNRVYIGKTENSIEQRFKEHCREYKRERAEARPLYRAMNKYGIEHFHIEPIEETDKPEEREKYWIEYFNSYHDGYNATLGGDGKAYLDRELLINTYLKKQNVAETAKILGVDAGHLREILKSNNIEIKSSQEIAKEKFSKKIAMYDLEGNLLKNFSSLTEAAEYIQIKQNKTTDIKGISVHIRQVAQGKRKTAYGFTWKYNIPQ